MKNAGSGEVEKKIVETDYVNSTILGRTKSPSTEERMAIVFMVEDCPLGVFQELNKYFNSRGLSLIINIDKKIEKEGRKKNGYTNYINSEPEGEQ